MNEATEVQPTELQDGPELPRVPVVPGYRLESRVGVGSFGEVWAAVQERTGQRVAVKLFNRQQGLDWTYFRQEVERLREVTEHPHVVTLLDADLEAATPFFVMPLLRHGSLADREAQAPVAQVLAWLKEIAGALQFTHEKGILHCDLKPSNILLDEQGRTRLVDFGQARLRDGTTGSLGTLGFMAPEQTESRAAPSVRWDVYSLGATAYFLLTNRMPRLSDDDLRTLRSGSLGAGDRVALYRGLLAATPLVPVRQLNPAVDLDLACVVERCLEPDPSRRTPSAAEVLADLERRERHEPLLCRRPWSRRYRLRTWLRRPMAQLGVLLLCSVLLGLGVSGAQMVDHARSVEANNLELCTRTALLTKKTKELRAQIVRQMLQQADQLESQADLHAALLWRAAVLSHQDEPTLQLGLKANPVRLVSLEQLEGATGLAAGGERYVLTLGARPRLYDVVRSESRDLDLGPLRAAWFSPDLRELAVIGEQNRLQRLQLPDLKPLGAAQRADALPGGGLVLAGSTLRKLDGGLRLQLPGRPERVVASPDGTELCLLYPDHAQLYRGDRPLGSPIPYTQISDAVFSPDGSRLALAGRGRAGHQVWVYEPGDSHPLFTLFHNSPVTQVAFSLDGQKLVTASQDGDLRRWSMRTGRQVPGIFHHGSPLLALATVDAYTFGLAADQTLREWKALHPRELPPPAVRPPAPANLARDPRVASLVGSPPPAHLARSPDGKLLAGLDGDRATLWTMTDGQSHPLTTAQPSSDQQLLFSPDGRTLAASCWDGVQVWSSPWEGKPRRLPVQNRDLAGHLAFSPDSRQLAWAGSDGSAQVWDLASGRRLLPWLPFPWSFQNVAFSSDGSWLQLSCEHGEVQLLDLAAAPVPVELDTGCRLNQESGLVEALTVREWQAAAQIPSQPHNLFEGRDYRP